MRISDLWARFIVVVTALSGLALGAVVACGGVGVEAPHVIGADEDTGCPSADDALAHARSSLGLDGTEGEIAELRPVMTKILADNGGARVLIQGIAALLEDANKVTLNRLLAGIDPAQGLGKLTPHVVEVLRYVDGSSEFVAGPHPEPIAAVHEIMAQCDGAETVATLRVLLELEIVDDGAGNVSLAPLGEVGDGAWLKAVLEGVRAVAEDPALREMFERIELEDSGEGGDGQIHVGKDAFTLLARLLAGNLAAPDFDPAATRALLESVLLQQVTDDASRARIDALLDTALLVTDPTLDVFPEVQSIMACVHDADADAAIPGMLYDWLTIEELSVDTFIDDISGSTSGEVSADLRLALIEVLRALETQPQVTRDLLVVTSAFFDEDNAPVVIRALLRLQGKGLVAELSGLTGAIAECDR